MNRDIYIAVLISAILHLAIVAGAFVLAYDFNHENDLLGGGGTGGVVAVSIVDEGSGTGNEPNLHSSQRGAAVISSRDITGPHRNRRGQSQLAADKSRGDGPASSGSGGGSGGGHGGGIGSGRGAGDPTLKLIWKKVNRSKYYPWQARKNGWEGAPRVSFVIGKNGEVHSISLVKSCGIPELDQAAIETIRRSAPLPYYPKSIILAIRYSLSD